MRHCSTAKKGFRGNRPKRAYFRQMADTRKNKGKGLCLTQPLSFPPSAPFVSEDKKNDRSAWAAVVFVYRPSQRSGLSFCVS